MLCSQRFSACWAPACASNSVRCDTRLHLASARASKEPSNEFQGFGGDKDVQEALLQQLRVQVDTQTLKDEIREDLKGKVANMKQIGEELISQLDVELGIEKFRAELESTQVLSDTNEKFNELEQQVQQIKDQIKADQEELRAFETASASARSQGLFFRNLYQPPADDSKGAGDGQTAAGNSMQRQGKQGFVDPAVLQAAAAVTASAEAEVRSPFRMYLFGYMAVVLALVTAQDLATPEPKYALDVLYSVLGLLLGINTYNERKALKGVVSRQQARSLDITESDAARSSSSSVDTSS